MGVNARAAPGVGDAQQPAHRQLLQAAGWAMPAFMLLPFVELLPDIAAQPLVSRVMASVELRCFTAVRTALKPSRLKKK